MRTIKDKHGRNIDYLRISITDRCNLRCMYCMPDNDDFICKNQEKLSNEEILKIARVSSKLGIRKIRLTGGEPLVRKGIVDLFRDINTIDGIEEICLTTNGILLDSMIEELSKNGLKKVNISLDTLNKEKYSYITRGGQLDKVLSAIDKAILKGIKVKLNVVIIKGINDNEIFDLVNLTLNKPIDVRFIELMPIGEGKKYEGLSNNEIISLFDKKGLEYTPINKDKNDGPAEYIKLKNAIGKVGFISAMSNCFCSQCNRIRVTSDGMLKQCLNWKSGVNLKKLIEDGISDDELEDIIKHEIYNKPKKYLFKKNHENKEVRFMNEIGG